MSKKLNKGRHTLTYKGVLVQFEKEKESWNNRGMLIEQKYHYENQDLINPTFILNQVDLYTDSMYYLKKDEQLKQIIKQLLYIYRKNKVANKVDKKTAEIQRYILDDLEKFNKDMEEELIYGKKIKDFIRKTSNEDLSLEDLKNQIRNIEQPQYMRTHIPIDILISGGLLNLKAWGKYRKIYRVEEIFVDYLQGSMKDDSDLDILQYIPYKSCAFQITAKHNYLHIVTIDTERRKGYITSYIPSRVEGGTEHRITIYSELDLSLKYKDCIKQSLIYSIGNPLDLYTSLSLWGNLKQGIECNLKTDTMRFFGALKQEKTGYGTFSFMNNKELANTDYHKCISDATITRPLVPNQREMLEQIISIVLTMLYYISAKGIEQSEKRYVYRGTEDITEEYNKRNPTKKNSQNDTKSLLYVSKIGVKETDFLKRNSIKETDKETDTFVLGCKYKYKPHVRKAHWHSYWVGKQDSAERHKELRFISPIIVNKDLGEVGTIEIQKIQGDI